MSRIPAAVAILAVSGAALPVAAATNPPARGHLVIVGGALDPKDAPVYQRILELGGPAATLGVLPTASGVPQESGPGTIEDFGKFMTPLRAEVVDITTTTPERARDPKYAARIAAHRILFFTGGVQSRILDVFRPAGGTTPAFDAVMKVLNAGGVVAGTSAGAAMMSDPMIAWGNSREALVMGLTQKEDAGVSIAQGMGFFPFGLTDQHFLRRGRLGRLVAALEATKITHGYGVDESCAIHADIEKKTVEVIGRRGCLFVDMANARRDGIARYNVRVSLLNTGDLVDATTGKVTPAAGLKELAAGGGMFHNIPPKYLPGQPPPDAWANYVIADLVGLLANSPGASWKAVDPNVEVTLSRDDKTRILFRSDAKPGEEWITVINARLDIRPRPAPVPTAAATTAATAGKP